jgi:hypothetical protein
VVRHVPVYWNKDHFIIMDEWELLDVEADSLAKKFY